MPELPEAETIARGMAAQVKGCVIASAVANRLDVVREGADRILDAVRGKRIERVRRRGKRIVIELQQGGVLVIALGMTGRLMVADASASAPAHTHLRLILDDGKREIRFQDPRRFGGVWYFDQFTQDQELAPLRLGAEPTTISLAEFRELLQRRRQIKALLMDQHALAGLGNIYCDESLHRAGIHPLASAHTLDELSVRKLHQAIRRVLAEAIRAGGSTLNDYRNASGDEGLFQIRHRVYGREGQSCLRCRDKIIRIQAAGRSTHLCPTCQLAQRRPRRRNSRG